MKTTKYTFNPTHGDKLVLIFVVIQTDNSRVSVQLKLFSSFHRLCLDTTNLPHELCSMTIGIQNGRMVWAKVQSVSFHTTQQQHLFRKWSRMMMCMAALWHLSDLTRPPNWRKFGVENHLPCGIKQFGRNIQSYARHQKGDMSIKHKYLNRLLAFSIQNTH